MSKKLFKNFIFIIVMAVLCFTFAVAVNAATTEDGLIYFIDSSNCVHITGYDGEKTDIVIPDTIKGYQVTIIDNNAFKNNTDITSISFPKHLKEIRLSAFEGCSNLKGELIIPDTVTYIGQYAFCGCKSFTGDLIIPEGVTGIYSSTFEFCTGLNGNLVIPDGVVSIGNGAFNGCSNLVGPLELPDSLTIIGYMSFDGCKNLTGDLVIPNGVTSIGFSAFDGCKKLTGNLIIPDSITSIAEYAFRGCEGLTGSLIISNSVTNISNWAFNNCNIGHIGYIGTQEEWSKVKIGSYNESLTNAEYIHINFNSETDITKVTTSPTCQTVGAITTVCSCGYTYSTETLALADCSFTTYTSYNNATCLADGTKTAYCDYGCSNSNTITDKGSAFGHDMSEYVVTKEVTCTVNGEERADCARCDYYETKELIANNHKDENLDGNCDYCNENIADKACLCVCHAKTIGAFVYRLFKAIDKIFKTRLIEKVFGITDICVCGIKH